MDQWGTRKKERIVASLTKENVLLGIAENMTITVMSAGNGVMGRTYVESKSVTQRCPMLNKLGPR